jgi:hypothetical protein
MNAKQSIHKFRKLVRAEATNQSDTSIYDLNNSIQLFDASEELTTEVVAQISVDLVVVVQLSVGNEVRSQVVNNL